MSYSITVTFDSLPEVAAWLRSQGQNVGNATVTTNAPAAVSQPASTAPEADPWTDAAPAATNAAPTATAPSGAPTTFTVNTPKGVQTWTLNAGNAPTCNCGQPAAFQEGNTNGRDWKRWTCAKAADKQNYKSKCAFNQFA